jgi:3-dehydroquinate dehydratase/shikimate dehydrogenase
LRSVAQEAQTPAVVIAMGDSGIATRALASRFHSCWTYAGNGVAPGQVPAARLLDEFSFRSIGPRTMIYGVVGRPIMHSLSPAMHNAAFKAARLDAVYLPLAAADFDDFVTFAEAMGLAGASVTAPFKLTAFQRADDCDPISRRIRSANTLRYTRGRSEACNTDVAGFLAPLAAQGVELRGTRVTVLGAGGAARAAVEALISAGAHVAISTRRRAQADAAARDFGCDVAAWPPAAHSWDVLVNTTPVGTAPAVDETPLPHGPFTGPLVYDLVYNPSTTRLLRDAARAGCRTIGGLDMLVAQAERQFEWWTGTKAPALVMHDAALRASNLNAPETADASRKPDDSVVRGEHRS